jgi:two-component system alkaline phosphatase synthesis response regulator PhoP
VPFKILVVEDNLDSRNLLHFYLMTKGYSAITAADGAEGIYLAKVEKPDLIVTDLMMPNLDGIELIRQIRSDPETADISIVIYTAFGSESAELALEAGANKIFQKPFDLDHLVEFIEQLPQQSEDKKYE